MNTKVRMIILATIVFGLMPFYGASAQVLNNTCAGVTVEIKSNSPVLSGQVFPPEIAEVSAIAASASEKCVVVRWSTDAPATSQVVYTPVSEFTGIDATAPRLGLKYASVQNNSGDVVHTAIIRGIELGEKYMFYVVSKANPTATPAVSGPYLVTIKQKPAKKEQQTQKTTPSYTGYTGKTQKALSSPVSKPSPVVNDNFANKVSKTESPDEGQGKKEGVVATEQTKAQEKTDKELAKVPSVLNALKDVQNVQEEKAQDSKLKTEDEKGEGDEGESAFLKSVWKLSFLLPALATVLFIWFLQKVILPYLNIVVEKPKVFWLFAMAVFAVAFALLSYFRISLVLVALFLILLGWHLLSEVTEEAKKQEEENKEGVNDSDAGFTKIA